MADCDEDVGFRVLSALLTAPEGRIMNASAYVVKAVSNESRGGAVLRSAPQIGSCAQPRSGCPHGGDCKMKLKCPDGNEI